MRTPSVEVSRKTQASDALGVPGLGEQSDQGAGAVLFHLHRRCEDVEGAGIQCLFGDVAEELRIQVVDIGFEDESSSSRGRSRDSEQPPRFRRW